MKYFSTHTKEFLESVKGGSSNKKELYLVYLEGSLSNLTNVLEDIIEPLDESAKKRGVKLKTAYCKDLIKELKVFIESVSSNIDESDEQKITGRILKIAIKIDEACELGITIEPNLYNKIEIRMNAIAQNYLN